ncbi:MAG TPA: hypothetical protein V6C78_11475 [Crinalium sp.]
MSPSIIAILLLVILGVGLAWRDRQMREGIDPNLLQATRGNKRLAKRLLSNARERYPGKSDRWYVEKVIYDLERDGAGGRRKPRSFASMTRGELRENLVLIGAFAWMLSAFSSLINNLFRR